MRQGKQHKQVPCAILYHAEDKLHVIAQNRVGNSLTTYTEQSYLRWQSGNSQEPFMESMLKRSLTLNTVISQINPLHILTTYFLKIHFTLPRHRRGVLSSGFLTKKSLYIFHSYMKTRIVLFFVSKCSPRYFVPLNCVLLMCLNTTFHIYTK